MNGEAHRPDEPSEELRDDVADDAAASAADTDESDPAAALEAAEKKASDNWDKYLRAAAEVENIRKRAARDVEHARKFALESFGRELLAVRDTLEMGIQAAESGDAASLLEGKQATLKMLASTMERFGISELDPEGEPFDPEFHEAMTMQPSDEAEPGSVLTVVQKGYALNGRLLRPAMVIVAREPETAEE